MYSEFYFMKVKNGEVIRNRLQSCSWQKEHITYYVKMDNKGKGVVEWGSKTYHFWWIEGDYIAFYPAHKEGLKTIKMIFTYLAGKQVEITPVDVRWDYGISGYVTNDVVDYDFENDEYIARVVLKGQEIDYHYEPDGKVSFNITDDEEILAQIIYLTRKLTKTYSISGR